MPSATEFLGIEEPQGPKRSANDFLGPEIFRSGNQFGGEYFDTYFQEQSAGRILDYFGQGFKDAWGTAPLGLDRHITKIGPTGQMVESDQTYKNLLDNLSLPIMRTFNEAVIRPLAATADATMRTLYGTARGLANVGKAFPPVVIGGREYPSLAAGPLPYIGGIASTILEGAVIPEVPHVPGHLNQLEAYRDVMQGDRAREAQVPETFGPSMPARTAEPFPEHPPVPIPEPDRTAPATPVDVHETARTAAPYAFQEHEALSAQRDELGRHIDELQTARLQDLRVQAIRAEITELTTNKSAVLTNTYRLEKNAALPDTTAYSIIGPDGQAVGGAHISISPDGKIAEIGNIWAGDPYVPQNVALQPDAGAPNAFGPGAIRQLIRDFVRQNPNVETIHGERISGARTEPASVSISRLQTAIRDTTLSADNRARLEAAHEDLHNLMETPEILTAQRQFQAVERQLYNTSGAIAEAYRNAARETETPVVRAPTEPLEISLADEPSPAILTLAQRRQSIANEVTAQATEAGRPREEARAIGAVWQAYYETRAARFEGALGSARELFDREAPSIIEATGKTRGGFDIAVNTIRVMEKGDASTLIHESGHAWLQDLIKDAEHPQAPAELTTDMAAVKAWLQEAATNANRRTWDEVNNMPSRAQHEFFARGFERYIMEGVAPTPRLQSVFSKFRDWLLRIYNNVSRLNAPINDQIRGVYARLLDSRQNDTVIAPERPITKSFADVHENDAITALPEEALTKAEQINAERDLAASLNTDIRPELLDEREFVKRFGYIRSPEAGGVAERTPVAGARTEGAKPAAAGEGGAPKPTTERAGGTPAERPEQSFSETDGSKYTRPDGFFRTEAINTPEDVPAAIQDGARQHERNLPGPITTGDLLDLSNNLGMNPAQLDPDKVRTTFISRPMIESVKTMLRQVEVDVREAMKAAVDGGPDEALALARQLVKNDMVQSYVRDMREAWGNAGNALKLLYEGPGATELTSFLKENSGRSYGQLMQMARSGQFMTEPGQINKFARDTKYGYTASWLLAYRTNSILSGLYTHMVYGLGNYLRAISDPIVSILSAGAQRALEAGGKEIPAAERIYAREAVESAATIFASTRAYREIWKAIPAAWYSGMQRTLPSSRSTNIFGINTTAYAPHFGIPGRSIAVIHTVGETLRYEQAKARLAMRQGLSEGLTGDELSKRVQMLRADPDDTLVSQAFGRGGRIMPDVPQEVQDWADIATRAREVANREMYIEPPEYNSRTAAVLRFMHSNPVSEAIFPFLSMHFNIMKENYLRHTPAGFLGAETRGTLLGARGVAAQSEALARQVLGMALFGTGVGFAMEGLAVGGGPVDPAQNNVWRLQHMPYSLEIGAIRIPMKGLPVVGDIMMMGADFYDAARHIHGQTKSQIATEYFRVFTRMAMDEGLLRDMEELTNAVNEPGRYAWRYLLNFGVSAVPFSSFGRQWNNFMLSPLQKDIHDVSVQSVINMGRSAVPFGDWMGPRIPNAIDIFGRPIMSRDAATHGLTGLLLQHVEQHNADPAAIWLNQNQLGIGKAERKIDNVDLTPEQYEQYAIVRGNIIHDLLTAGLPVLSKLSDGMKKVQLHTLVTKATKAASATIMVKSLGTLDDISRQAYEKKLELLK